MTGRNRVMVSAELFSLREKLTLAVDAIDAVSATKGKR
jgi:hypothetical protein